MDRAACAKLSARRRGTICRASPLAPAERSVIGRLRKGNTKMRAIAATAILAFIAGFLWSNHLNAPMFDKGATFGANMALREMDGCASDPHAILGCMHLIAELNISTAALSKRRWD
jgi:hypothetical protein